MHQENSKTHLFVIFSFSKKKRYIKIFTSLLITKEIAGTIYPQFLALV